MIEKPKVGDKVRVNQAFMLVPEGTMGVVDQEYEGGVMVAWDLPNRPLPEGWTFDLDDPTTWAINPENPLRDGFSVEEWHFLDRVE